jgi:hypothetical protein
MWIVIFLLLTIILGIRNNKLLRTYFQSYLYRLGLQFGTHIYTLVGDVYSDFRYFDIVFLKKHKENLHGFRLFNQEDFCILMKYVPVGHHLIYKVNDKVKEHLYLDGTPFEIDEGELILYRKVPKRFGYISEEHSRSNKWPFGEE